MSGEKEPTSPSANNGNASAVCTKKSCPKEWKHSSQEKSNSCVIASSKNMIKMLAGKDISEEKLRIEMKEIMKKPKHDFNKDGINPAHAKTLLKNHGIENKSLSGVKSEDLSKHIKDNKPILIGFKNPGHRVLLDSVEKDKDGNNIFYVRDPGSSYKGKIRKMNQKDFDKKYNDKAIIIVPK